MLILFVGSYLLLTLLIGWYASRQVKSSTDFAIAGRRMPIGVVSAGLFATWFGSETLMGASSEFLEKGILGVIEDPFGAALCLLLIGRFYAKPLYRLNILTFSDYFKMKFGKTAEWVSAAFVIPSYFSWIAAQFVALAFLLEVIAQVPFTIGVTICCLVVVLYTYIGGMWSVAVTDTLQTLIIIVGMLALSVSLYTKAGGIEAISNQVPDSFWHLYPHSSNSIDWLIYFSAWITIGLGSIPQQDVFQRILSAKNEKVAVQGSYWAGIMYFTIATLPLLAVLCGGIAYPEIRNYESQVALPLLVIKHMGLGFQVLTFGALLSAILSTCSGAILAPATVLAQNLILPLNKGRLNDKQILQYMRFSVVFIALISLGLALYKKHIFELVAESSALSLVALFIPLTAGLYWKKANSNGAIFSMLLGTLVWTYFEFFPNEVPSLIWGTLASFLGLLLGVYLFPKK